MMRSNLNERILRREKLARVPTDPPPFAGVVAVALGAVFTGTLAALGVQEAANSL